MQPDRVRETFRDYRWGGGCPVHTLRHWCHPCRKGDGDHAVHSCACGATTEATDGPA